MATFLPRVAPLDCKGRIGQLHCSLVEASSESLADSPARMVMPKSIEWWLGDMPNRKKQGEV